MTRFFGFKRAVAVLTAVTLLLGGTSSLAWFGDAKGVLHFCVDPSWGGVRLLVGTDSCNPANEQPFEIQQPFKYSASRDNGPTGVIAPAAVNESTEITIISLKVPAGTYNIEAKTNLRITNKDTVEVEAYLSECDLAYYQGTDPEFDADTTTWTTAPKYGDDIAQVVHNLQAVKTFTSDTTIAIECNVTATRRSTLPAGPVTIWDANFSKLAALVLVGAEIHSN
jgi:hypothetical protein